MQCAIFLLAIETKLDLQTNIDTFPFSAAELSQQSTISKLRNAQIVLKFKRSQECETVLTSQYQTLFLFCVFLLFICLFQFFHFYILSICLFLFLSFYIFSLKHSTGLLFYVFEDVPVFREILKTVRICPEDPFPCTTNCSFGKNECGTEIF